MNRIFTRPDFRFLWGVSFTCGLLALMSGVLWNGAVLDHSPPIKDMSGKVLSITKNDNGTRRMIVEWTGTRQRHCLGTSERWLVNGYVHPLPSLPFPPRDNEEIGSPVNIKVAVDIPADFPAHKGEYHVVSSYQCNTIQVQFPKLLSVVVKPPPVLFDLTGEAK
jgi:hypothetical protein